MALVSRCHEDSADCTVIAHGSSCSQPEKLGILRRRVDSCRGNDHVPPVLIGTTFNFRSSSSTAARCRAVTDFWECGPPHSGELSPEEQHGLDESSGLCWRHC